MKKIKNKLPHIKYLLEIISIPMFAFLVFHLAGHSLGEYFESETAEILGGAISLIVFTLLWNTKKLKRFVPCSHTDCHGEKMFGHILASFFFVFHFFPESAIRYEFLVGFDYSSILSVFGLIAFLSHFLIDLIIIYMISSYWKKTSQKIISAITMIIIYIFSYYIGKTGGLDLHFLGDIEIFIGLISAFALSMFIHIPEKPKKECGLC